MPDFMSAVQARRLLREVENFLRCHPIENLSFDTILASRNRDHYPLGSILENVYTIRLDDPTDHAFQQRLIKRLASLEPKKGDLTLRVTQALLAENTHRLKIDRTLSGARKNIYKVSVPQPTKITNTPRGNRAGGYRDSLNPELEKARRKYVDFYVALGGPEQLITALQLIRRATEAHPGKKLPVKVVVVEHNGAEVNIDVGIFMKAMRLLQGQGEIDGDLKPGGVLVKRIANRHNTLARAAQRASR